MTEGENYGIRNIGHYAWDSLRVQKGIVKAPNEIGLNTPSEMMKQCTTLEEFCIVFLYFYKILVKIKILSVIDFKK